MFITPPVFVLKFRWGLMHFYDISLSDFNNTIKLPAVDRRREGGTDGGGINYEKKEVNIRYWYISHPK